MEKGHDSLSGWGFPISSDITKATNTPELTRKIIMASDTSLMVSSSELQSRYFRTDKRFKIASYE